MRINYILTLLESPGIGKKTVNYVLNNHDSDINSSTELIDLLIEAKIKNKRIYIPSKEEILEAENEANRIIEESTQKNISLISLKDPTYPRRFFDLNDAPPIISTLGDQTILNTNHSVAIIGTREPSSYAIKVGERLAEIFAENGFTIISGLALGCDTLAHRGCIKVKGKTIAVLANGLDKIYPKENNQLAELIVNQGGCLITEYNIGTPPLPNYFVDRDRLQSGLSQGVIVIETDVKGGTMHTVRFAQQQNRKLACLYSHPENLQSHSKFQGNKFLVSQGKAIALITPDDIQLFISNLRGEHKTDKVVSNFNVEGQGELFS